MIINIFRANIFLWPVPREKRPSIKYKVIGRYSSFFLGSVAIYVKNEIEKKPARNLTKKGELDWKDT